MNNNFLLNRKVVMCDIKDIENILKFPTLFMKFNEAKMMRESGKWGEKCFLFLNEVGSKLRLYSKSNTIAITDFFRKNFEICFDKESPNKTIENYKRKIWESENDRELLTRIIKDYYYVLKAYYEYLSEREQHSKRFLLPRVKNKYKEITLKERKKLKYEHILTNRVFGKMKLDLFVEENKETLEKITIGLVCKWVDYIMLWGTYYGTIGEMYVMDFLKREVKEIDWRWSTQEEDIRGIDIVGKYRGIEIKIQVKLTRGGRIGERGLDYSDVITMYVNVNGEKFIAPRKIGEIGWRGFFEKIVETFS